jgi:hypothetical protein
MDDLTVTACLAPDDEVVAPAALHGIESALLFGGASDPRANYDERRRSVDVTFYLQINEGEDAARRLASLMATLTRTTASTLIGLAYYTDGTLPL